MTRRAPFRWTRQRYRRAASLCRFFARVRHRQPDTEPELLQRFFALWERHPQSADPLLTPLHERERDSDIPF